MVESWLRVIQGVIPELGGFLIEQGAYVSIHAAAAMGLADVVQRYIADDPRAMHAKGGDGATPLHFTSTREVAGLLIDAGADLNATDDDHNSTPAQWLIGDRPEVSHYLLQCRASPDIFICAALGDLSRIQQLADDNPMCLAYRIGKIPFPPLGYQAKGGTILQ